jgi:hypothetical protein
LASFGRTANLSKSLFSKERYLPLDGVRARFAGEPRPLGLIYIFAGRSAEPAAPCIEELRPREALLQLVQNTYMNWLLDRKERAEEFEELAACATSAGASRHRACGRHENWSAMRSYPRGRQFYSKEHLKI